MTEHDDLLAQWEAVRESVREAVTALEEMFAALAPIWQEMAVRIAAMVNAAMEVVQDVLTVKPPRRLPPCPPRRLQLVAQPAWRWYWDPRYGRR